jgi:enoyl-CoA hydratase/carnithine racemase
MTEAIQNSDVILVENRKGILIATFNRPKKKNALTHAMYARLVELLELARTSDDVRALCLCGAGGCFTSGNDLMDFLSNPPKDENSPVLQFIHGLIDFNKPLIAAVEGPAIGIGTTMLLHCDLIYASDTAVFQMPFTKLALCPEAASSYLLPRVIGLQRATELLLTSRSINAETALEWGLITEVLPGESFSAAVENRLEALAALPPEALRATKALIRRPDVEQIHEAAHQEAFLFAQRLASGEAAEAMQAFLERRPPDFSRFA